MAKKTIGAELIDGLTELRDTLAKGEPVDQRFTVRKVKLDLKPTAYNAHSVKTTRMRMGVSQSLFAQLLGISAALVQSWEQGSRIPNKMACRLLDEMNSNPLGWRQRVLDAAEANT